MMTNTSRFSKNITLPQLTVDFSGDVKLGDTKKNIIA